MHRPIRVLLWSARGAGEHYHGPGSFAHRLYSSASPGRFEITLAHGSTEQRRYPLFKEQHLIYPLRGGVMDHCLFLGKARRWLHDHAGHFDVFHGLTGFHSTVYPAWRAHKLGLPAVVFLANHQIDLTDKSGLKKLVGLPARRRKMAKEIEALVAMSAAIHDELRSYGFPAHQIARIPMGVDERRFYPASDDTVRRKTRAKLGWPEQKPTVLFVGGITPRKRPDLLIEALALLRARGCAWQLALVGPEHDERYCSELKQLARTLQVHTDVIWHGFTEAIDEPFRAADCFALPSMNEGMPAALVEAMASGLPSIVTPVSGMTDLVIDGVHGRMVQHDAHRIAEALADYQNNPAKARDHGQAARRRVFERFSLTAVLDAYEQLFLRVIDRADAGGSSAFLMRAKAA